MTDHAQAVPDETRPEGPWVFDQAVTAAFGDMLDRSIPDHDGMREVVTGVTSWVAERHTTSVEPPLIVDLGASRGEQIARLASTLPFRAQYLGCDVSEPMLDAARSDLSQLVEAGDLDLVAHDLRPGLPPFQRPPSVILAVLTLMFVPIEHRQTLVEAAHAALAPGGAMIVVEKVLGRSAPLARALIEQYHAMKRANGYSVEAVERKAASLEGVLVPLTTPWNEDMLRRTGFDVELVWARLNFRGWLCLKHR
jgi:tRNA (cmo5U34)-methyltransferase